MFIRFIYKSSKLNVEFFILTSNFSEPITMDPKSKPTVDIITDSLDPDMKTEAGLLVCAKQARLAVQGFTNVLNMTNPPASDLVIKGAMEHIVKSIVSLILFVHSKISEADKCISSLSMATPSSLITHCFWNSRLPPLTLSTIIASTTQPSHFRTNSIRCRDCRRVSTTSQS